MASCKHSKRILGKAIVSKITIGIKVHVFSNNSESGVIEPFLLKNTPNLTRETTPKITNSQTITPS